jgi:O-antigen ligase
LIIAGALALAGLTGIWAFDSGVVALAIPVATLGGVVLFARPSVGLFLFAAMIPVESALMIGGRSVAALVGMAVFGVWASRKLLRREPLLLILSSRLTQLSFFLFAYACLSLLWAYDTTGVQRQLVLLLQLILLSALVLDLASSWERVAWVARFLVLAGTVAALMTAEQYFFGDARRAGEGVTGGINRTAVTLVTILPFAFYLWRSAQVMAWRLLGLTYIGLSAVAVMATFSRMNYLLLPIVVFANLVLMARVARERVQVLALAAVGVLALSWIPMDALQSRVETIVPYVSQTVASDDSFETYSARGYLMRIGLEMFKDRPLLGSGYDNYRAQTDIYQWRVSGSPYEYLPEGRSPHSSHMAMLVGLGVVGFLIWMSLFVLAGLWIWNAWRDERDPASDRSLLLQALGIAVGLQIIYGFYGLTHTDKLVWLVLGLAAAVRTLPLHATRGRRSGVGLSHARPPHAPRGRDSRALPDLGVPS